LTNETQRTDPEARLIELGLTLPPVGVAQGNYVKSVRTGNLLFVSGHLPDSSGEPLYMGKLGRDLTTVEGYEASQQALLSLLASIRTAVGNLNAVQAIVKLFGMVNSTEDFIEQGQVINGASDLLRDVFGDKSLHARSAVGMAQLPRNNCVELEAIVEVADD
jgi:enamine deaminase RidA (YjgF/YER057c/UK114 family)